MKKYPDDRLFSLDLLRGLDMFFLAAVGVVMQSAFKVWDCPVWLQDQFRHPWLGFSAWDIIMPLFIFMCGAAMPFALGRRLREGKGVFWRHVLGRVALLWVLGMVVQGGLLSFDPKEFSPYCNTLQSIACGYLVTAAVMMIPSLRVRIAIPILLTVAYGLIVHFCGDYTKTGNITCIIDVKIFGAILPQGSNQVRYISEWGYTWFLPSMMFAVITLCGYFSTEILRSGLGPWAKAAALGVFGALSLGIGWALVPWVPMIKHFFTVSFTLQAIGWSVLLLGTLYVLTDIWKIRRGLGLFILFGQTALTAYICEGVFREACFSVSERLFGGFADFFGTARPFVIALGYVVVLTAILWIRRRLNERKRT